MPKKLCPVLNQYLSTICKNSHGNEANRFQKFYTITFLFNLNYIRITKKNSKSSNTGTGTFLFLFIFLLSYTRRVVIMYEGKLREKNNFPALLE